MRLILPGELAKHAISEGTKSVTSMCLALADIEKILIDLHRILIGGGEVNIFVICLFSFLHCNSLYLINSIFFSLSDMLWAIDLRISLYHCLLSH